MAQTRKQRVLIIGLLLCLLNLARRCKASFELVNLQGLGRMLRDHDRTLTLIDQWVITVEKIRVGLDIHLWAMRTDALQFLA